MRRHIINRNSTLRDHTYDVETEQEAVGNFSNLTVEDLDERDEE